MLELWKPLLILKDKNNPVIFDELGQKFSDSVNIKNEDLFDNKTYNNHPFIIFYDDKEDCYYYLEARGAYKKDNKTLKNKFKGKLWLKK